MKWRYLIGLLIVIVALGYILELMYVPGLRMSALLYKWWPLAIIILSGNYLIRRQENPWGTLLLIGLGIFLLVRQQNLDIFGIDVIAFTAVVVLLLFGLRLMLPQSQRTSGDKTQGIPANFQPSVKDFVIFGGSRRRNQSQQFKGGKVVAVMGDYEVDLREAILSPQGAELEVSALFGSVIVRLPEEMSFRIEGKPFLGGLENSARPLVWDEPGRPVLRIKCHVALASLSVQN